MAFNLTNIEVGGKKVTKQAQSTDKSLVQTPLVKFPADKVINKYPVRVFTIQPQPQS